MADIITYGLKLSYKETDSATSYTALTNLQEIPDLGGTVESLETTTTDDPAHTYCNGLISYGESLDFQFKYEPVQFATLAAMTGDIFWQVGIPDGTDGAIGTTVSFKGEPSVRLNGQGTNAVMTYTLSIKPKSVMAFA